MPRLIPSLALALLLAGCGRSGPEGARLAVTVLGSSDEAGADDGDDGTNSVARRLEVEATQPTLVGRDGGGQTVARLATSWRFVDDGRSLILRLRPMKWSDGKPLVAADVVASFRRAAQRRDPVVARAGFANAAQIIDRRLPASRLGVLAPIARVVELRLDDPSPLLLGWLAEPGLAITRDGATLGGYIASGPAGRRVLKRVAMDATPDARPAEIVITSSDDTRAAIADFVAGKQDIVIGAGLAGLGEARAGARPDALRIDPVSGIYGYLVNGLKGPTADPGVRRALAMAVDRDRLVASFGLAAMQPAESLIPTQGVAARLVPGVIDPQGDATMADTTPWTQLDPAARLAEAQRLLAAAGWTADHPLRLVLSLPPGRDHRAVAERVGADWARVGVILAVTEVQPAAFDRLVARGDFDLALRDSGMAVPDAAAMLAQYRCGAGPYCNPAADAVLARARAADAAAQPALLAEVDTMMMAAPPLVPLFTPIRWALVARGVDGWIPNRAGSHPLARLATANE